MKRIILALGLCSWIPFPALAGDAVAGWRGNWTGMWPEARTPLHWERIPQGLLHELRAQADRPKGEEAGKAPAMASGLVPEWLVLGPVAVADSVKDFDQPAPFDEAAIRPGADDKSGSLAWKRWPAPLDDPNVFGTAELPWMNLAPAIGGFQRNRVVYAHAYLHAPRAGTVRAVVEHSYGLKVWLNGQPVYRAPTQAGVLSYYTAMSRYELNHSQPASPCFELNLKPGWNRLLLKLSSANKEGYEQLRFCLRLMDPPSVSYKSKNIVWMAELPQRSSSTPILVGDRIFVMAEPDELLCLDRKTGRLQWSAFVNFYEALAPKERQANPAFAKTVDPLIAELRVEKDFVKRIETRGRIQKALLAIDPDRFAIKADGHFEAHFAIVGFTAPTPVSDGKHVYVWSGMGVAACFDLDGKRRWITRIPGELSYASTPTLVDGTLVVFLNRLYGLDAKTGEVRWKQSKVTRNVGALVPARLSGVPVIVSQRGDVVRAADGRLLFKYRQEDGGDTGWAPPLVLGDTVYASSYGVASLARIEFQGVQGDDWQPKVTAFEMPASISRKPDGKWIDRWTAGSPLVLDDIAYSIDIWGQAFALDLKSRKMLYQQDTGLRGFFHYNSLGVAASPTLLGKHIVVQDNQGTALLLEPGPKYQVAARNRIATVLDRPWPLPGQETLSYGPPISDGRRLYLRGERYLYCIGEAE